MAIVVRCLLVLGLLAAFPALAQQEPQQEPPGRVGRVVIISGTLAFYGPGDTEWSAAPINLPVATGGWFATDPKSRAQFRIGPDTVNLAEDTQLNIADLRDGVLQLALPQGRIGLQLHRPAWRKNQTAEIDIARGGVWLLQPGDYDIDAGSPDRATRISVFEGSARFVGGGIDKVINAGERLVLTGGDTLTAAIERAEPDDFANWCRDHGIRQDRVAAARRVSPAMTGFEELEEYGQWGEAADYGAVWYPKSLPADWAPYRAGRWVWVEPWGWNWVDDQPWGFAPFHYGRWALVGDRWAWVPGEFVAQPVYAPALVAFLPQPAVEVAVAADAGPPIGWFPLAPGEFYWPSYTRNPTYIRNVNISNVRINVINQVTTALLTRRGTADPPPLILNQRFVNRPAATVVPAQVVMRSAPVAPAVVRVPDRELRQTRVAALPPPAVARPAAAAAVAAATMPRLNRQPSSGAALAPSQPQVPTRPDFGQLARAPRLGHGTAAVIPAALPGRAAAQKPGEAPAATAAIPPPAPHQPPTPPNAAASASPRPPGRPDFANLPQWRPHDALRQAQPGVPTPPNAGLPVPPFADPAAHQRAAQELAQQRAARQQEQRTAGEAARQQQLERRAAQQQATAEQRAAREQARAAQLAQQRAAAEAGGHHQAQQRIAQQQAAAEQRAAREQARAAQLGQQRAAAEAARQHQAQQRAAQQQAIPAQQMQQRAAADAARQQQAAQRAAAEAARQHQSQQRAAQQQAVAAQQAQQRAAQQAAAQQRAAQQAAAQQAAAQHAAQQQAMAAQQAQQRAAQQAAAQQAAAQRAAQQQAMAAQQAQQRAAQQAAAQQAAAQRAAQQQAMAAHQAQQRAAQQAAQQQQKGQQKQAHACGGPGQPACPQH